MLKFIGMVFGSTPFEKRNYTVLQNRNGYEIRKYPACVATTVSSNDVSHEILREKGEDGFRDVAFHTLGKYFGVIGDCPQNLARGQNHNARERQGEKIGMTSPVRLEKVKQKGNGKSEDILVMTFYLPKRYKIKIDAPEPTDVSVKLVDVPSAVAAVDSFSWNTNLSRCQGRAEELRKRLEKDGFKMLGNWQLDRWNPWFCLPFLKRNELLFPLDPQSVHS